MGQCVAVILYFSTKTLFEETDTWHLGTTAMCYKFNTSTPYGFIHDDHQLYFGVSKQTSSNSSYT